MIWEKKINLISSVPASILELHVWTLGYTGIWQDILHQHGWASSVFGWETLPKLDRCRKSCWGGRYSCSTRSGSTVHDHWWTGGVSAQTVPPQGRERRKNAGQQSFKCSQDVSKATSTASPCSQLGGRASRSKPLSTVSDVARGKDEQLVDLSGFYERELCGE